MAKRRRDGEPGLRLENRTSEQSIGLYMRRILDISPLITPALAVWPGDTPPNREVLLEMERGDTVTLSSLHSTVHLGSHADAPSHFGKGARGIESRPLEDYLGPCQVIGVAASTSSLIGPEALGVEITEERILIHTGTYPDPNRFQEDFAALAPELVDFLHERGVRLVGVDTPSVDLFDSKDLPAHRRFLVHDMAIIEGLVLEDVPPGRYELIALPRRLVGFDASPVRAVLRTLS
jgi:arylformamidase